MNLTIRVRDEDGLWAAVDELPGCFASGHSLPELFEALVEAIQMWRGPAGEEATGE